VARFLRRHQRGGVLVATAAAVGTPLCSCGTTAIVLGMMAGSMPWAPIIAFMVASPLTSPQELIYSAGLFGWPFAIAFFAASIGLGLAGGAFGAVLDARGWLRNQSRFGGAESACRCGAVAAAAMAPATAAVATFSPAPASIAFAMPLPEAWSFASSPDVISLAPSPACACSGTGGRAATAAPSDTARWSATAGAGERGSSHGSAAGFDWRAYLAEVAATARRLVPMFLAFAALGYLINDLIPAAWIAALFGSGHAYSVPLAATLGLPFYVNSEASLPLVSGMLSSGMSAGAALAFLITGAGTSLGALAGAMTIARWRVIGLVVATLWLGAIACGFAYDALSAAPLL
jgi:hypothetical protein